LEQEPLASISEASRILGVSEAALRQWTNEGRIKAFITPGGHRRYSRADLKKFMSSHQKILGIRDLVIELEDTAQLHREIARESFSNKPWADKLTGESHEQLADFSRQLLGLIVRYITEPSRREEITRLVRDVGRSFGGTLAELGLPLTDSVEAFILHRDPLIKAATHLMSKREAYTRRVVESVPLVAQVMDETMVALVAAHQEKTKWSPARVPGK